MSEAVTVALDWTPNTNHIGFFVAKARGLYTSAGLAVTLRSPHVDQYHETPAALLADRRATFAVTPSESVISHNTLPDAGKAELRAVAALLQHDTSAIVALASSGIARPAQLDEKVYASYGARYEGRIVQALIRADGGAGEYEERALPMLGIWETLLQGKADATWVFMGWEGVEARLRGVQLNAFPLGDFGVPYGYSPLLAAHPDTLRDRPDVVRSFLAATAEGYRLAAESPAEAADLMLQAVAAEYRDAPLSPPLDPSLVQASAQQLAKEFLTADGRWGCMDAARWDSFLDWLATNGLLTTKVQSRAPVEGVSTSLEGLRAGDVGVPLPRDSIKAEDLFTNEFLP